MIAGFPQETPEDFADSLKLMEEAEFGRVHVFPYSKRPGTTAASMDGQIPPQIKAERAAELIRKADETAARFLVGCIGEKRTVLFEEEEGGFFTGYTDNYVKVYVPAFGAAGLLNSFKEVRLLEIYKDGMKGEI